MLEKVCNTTSGLRQNFQSELWVVTNIFWNSITVPNPQDLVDRSRLKCDKQWLSSHNCIHSYSWSLLTVWNFISIQRQIAEHSGIPWHITWHWPGILHLLWPLLPFPLTRWRVMRSGTSQQWLWWRHWSHFRRAPVGHQSGTMGGKPFNEALWSRAK